ncbi:MAG: YqaJ viral recombinase family protein [Acidobacteria bacterium]|nr:YqaJ viral recombinase family protein [Acidobacteriota bacterium]
MTPVIIDCQQRSPEWFVARLGHLTSSTSAEMMSKGRKPGEESAGRRNLRIRLALERLTGTPITSGYQSRAIQDGIDREATSIGAYEAHTARLVSSVGFVRQPELMAGCSADAVVFDGERIVRGVEAKNPEIAAHWAVVQSKQVPSEYRFQLVHSLWVTGAEAWDFVSHHPAFPPELQLVVVEYPRVEHEMASYEIEARAFLAQVDRTLAEMQEAAKGAAA